MFSSVIGFIKSGSMVANDIEMTVDDEPASKKQRVNDNDVSEIRAELKVMREMFTLMSDKIEIQHQAQQEQAKNIAELKLLVRPWIDAMTRQQDEHQVVKDETSVLMKNKDLHADNFKFIFKTLETMQDQVLRLTDALLQARHLSGPVAPAQTIRDSFAMQKALPVVILHRFEEVAELADKASLALQQTEILLPSLKTEAQRHLDHMTFVGNTFAASHNTMLQTFGVLQNRYKETMETFDHLVDQLRQNPMVAIETKRIINDVTKKLNGVGVNIMKEQYNQQVKAFEGLIMKQIKDLKDKVEDGLYDLKVELDQVKSKI